ncbi:MAG TPA: helix-turn-helix domain-containing protein [Pyrinomonadaceae bacterium]|nr:helix-turn-helix domain-containing protein [Pyrinomonadaceae bacterium]
MKRPAGGDFRHESSERPVRVIRMVTRNSDADAELQRARQMVRLDALKALIGLLLDQLDELTNPNLTHDEMDSSLQSMVRHFETELIRHALIRTGGRQRAAARLLAEKKTTLNAKILRYGIEVHDGAAQSGGTPGPDPLRREVI